MIISSAAHWQETQGKVTVRRRFSMLAGPLFLWSMVGFPFVASTLNALNLPSTEIVIVVRILVLAACLAMIAVGLAMRRYPRNIESLLFIVFFAAYILRLAHDTAYLPHLLGKPSYMYWSFAIGVCLAPALALALYARHLDIIRLYHPLTLLCAFVLLVAIRAGSTRMLGSSGDEFDSGRLTLESLNPISLGHVGVSVAILAYWRVRMLGSGFWGLLHSLMLGLLGLYVLFASGSRGPLIAMILSVVFFEAVKGGKTSIFFALGTAPFLAMLSLSMDRLDAILGTNLFSRLDAAIYEGDASSISRVAQMSSAWDMFLDAPLLGSALEDPAFAIYPHNIIVEAFMAMGIVGGALMILLLASTGWLGFRLARTNPALSIYGALFVQYTVAAQFSGSIYTCSTAWALLACIIGLKHQLMVKKLAQNKLTSQHQPTAIDALGIINAA